MSDKASPPDGYIAWHPSEFFLNELHGSEMIAWAHLMGFVHPEKTPAKLIAADPDKKTLAESGWRVRPVKLLFLDEAKHE